MTKPKRPRPTDAELAILRVLWQRGPSTVRDVQEALGPDTGYTTALKLMQIMTEKKLLVRDESSRTHIYSPASSEQDTQRHLIRDLAARAFQGSPMKLVLQALSTQRTSPKELSELRKLIDDIEKKGDA